MMRHCGSVFFPQDTKSTLSLLRENPQVSSLILSSISGRFYERFLELTVAACKAHQIGAEAQGEHEAQVKTHVVCLTKSRDVFMRRHRGWKQARSTGDNSRGTGLVEIMLMMKHSDNIGHIGDDGDDDDDDDGDDDDDDDGDDNDDDYDDDAACSDE
ncbi:hypothetical protein ElyMa_003041700 [Elysia marginata]|uniref:Uncharacterized protein n=1 Tax=Elysia marginata TaxID=1093978 RepID=A0AAV4IEA6_9GAST|nr:hypothetical protein ElyMa_003041700 [Elysia marginata]